MPKTATITLTGVIMPDDWLFPGDGFYPPSPGISLLRVQASVQAAGDFDNLTLDIDSDGGVIEEGWRIFDYIKSLGVPVKTRSIGVVASMATILMMLGEERLLSPHAKFIVHQPAGGMDGNINDFKNYLAKLEAEQARLLEVYSVGTGQADTVIAEILADGNDHEYTADEALAFGWTTGIYEVADKATARSGRRPIMAHLSDGRKALNLPEHKSPNLDMSKFSKRLLAALGVAQAVAAGAPLVNILVDTADGKKLNIESTGDAYVVGDAVTFEDGSEVPDADYILSDGNTITVTGGTIADIIEPEPAAEVDPANPAPVAQVEETVTISKAEHERLTALEAKVTSLTASVARSEAFEARVTKVLAMKESADPVAARLPETPIERRVAEAPKGLLEAKRELDEKKKKK